MFAAGYGGDTTSITTKATGDLLVFAAWSIVLSCGAGTACTETYGIYLDGNPVPKTARQVAPGAGGTINGDFTVYGLVKAVGAGLHTLQLRRSGPSAGWATFGLHGVQVGGIALDGS